MIHDEKTTEIEIPGLTKKTPDNVVPMNFARRKTDRKPVAAHEAGSVARFPTAAPTPSVHTPAFHRNAWLTDLDPRTPWLLRMLAVLTVLGLSLLML